MAKFYKRLCRHYWGIDPEATVFHISSYREMWGNEAGGVLGILPSDP